MYHWLYIHPAINLSLFEVVSAQKGRLIGTLYHANWKKLSLIKRIYFIEKDLLVHNKTLRKIFSVHYLRSDSCTIFNTLLFTLTIIYMMSFKFEEQDIKVQYLFRWVLDFDATFTVSGVTVKQCIKYSEEKRRYVFKFMRF